MSELFQKENIGPSEGTSGLLALKTHLEGSGKSLLDEGRLGRVASDLGFFSKPFRISFMTTDYIIKLYSPVRNTELTGIVMKNHDEYINELRSAGIKVSETLIFSRFVAKNTQLVIIQKAFDDEELLRKRVIYAPINELYDLCNLIFNDVMKFWNNIVNHKGIGFHPTLRNYALHGGELYYFDTFPPMFMTQEEINKLILRWSPFGGWIRYLIPSSLLNRVSDEYYNLDKMFSGIVGSFCRLRPADADMILGYSRTFVKDSNDLSSEQKETITRAIINAPRLSGTWLFIRRISGNKGRPNIRAGI